MMSRAFGASCSTPHYICILARLLLFTLYYNAARRYHLPASFHDDDAAARRLIYSI